MSALARQTFRSLTNRDFRRYFLAQLVSATGSWMHRLAEVWLVLQLGGSSFDVGILAGLQFAPLMVFGLWGGVFVDLHNTRNLLIAAEAAFVVNASVLAVLVIAGGARLWVVLTLAGLAGMVSVVEIPARRKLIVELVGREDVSNAISLQSTLNSTARTVGPAIAGILIAVDGTSTVLIINALSYVVIVIALLTIEPRNLTVSPPSARTKGQIREGLRFVWSSPVVRDPILILAIVGTLVFEFQVTLPLLATETFEGGSGTLGALMSLLSLGSMAGALYSASRQRLNQRHVIASTMLIGLAILVSAPFEHVWLFALPLVVAGLGLSLFLASANTIVQLNTPDHLQGRVIALFSLLFLGSSAVGGPLVGWLSGVVTPRATFAASGVVALLTGVAAWYAQHLRVRADAAAPAPSGTR